MVGSSDMPHVPPSTSSTSSGKCHRASSRASTASPNPSSPMIGLPSPMTVVLGVLILVFVPRIEETPSRDDRRDGAAALHRVCAERQVDVRRDEDQEEVRDRVVHEAHVLDAAEERDQPVGQLV